MYVWHNKFGKSTRIHVVIWLWCVALFSVHFCFVLFFCYCIVLQTQLKFHFKNKKYTYIVIKNLGPVLDMCVYLFNVFCFLVIRVTSLTYIKANCTTHIHCYLLIHTRSHEWLTALILALCEYVCVNIHISFQLTVKYMLAFIWT